MVREKTKEETEFDEFMASTKSIQKQIEEKFPDELVRIIVKISAEISMIGLTEEEACRVADYPYAQWLLLKKKYRLIRRLMEMKELEYKRTLLKSINQKAKTDDKYAQWLLMARFPGEFNQKKGKTNDGDESNNMITKAIEFVRKHGDERNIVSEMSGKEFKIKHKKVDGGDALTNIKNALV